MTTSMTLSINNMTIAISAIIYVLTVIGTWKIYSKMNEPGWKALIPFYNTYTLFKHIWTKEMGYVYICTGIITVILDTILQITPIGNPIIALVFSIITIIVMMTWLAIKIVGLNKLAQAFGHSTGYTLGLIFFEPIFTMILGFGKDEYQMA